MLEFEKTFEYPEDNDGESEILLYLPQYDSREDDYHRPPLAVKTVSQIHPFE